MANAMLDVLEGFSLVWVLIPVYRHYKSAFYQVTLNFEFEDISSRHFTSNFAHSFDFHCFINFAKKYQFVIDGFSLVCVLFGKFSIYILKSDQWITIWWAKFELEYECLLLIIIKVTCKNADFEWRYIRTHNEEKHLNFQHYIRHFDFFW